MKSFFKKAQHGLSRAEGGAKKFSSKDTANKVDGVLRKVQNALPKIADGIDWCPLIGRSCKLFNNGPKYCEGFKSRIKNN